MSSSETKEAIATLRDRLKHGQNMTKILESQLDTAQQNISLLQGQVRLANETILNLKKYFQETENALGELLSSNYAPSRVFHFDMDVKDADAETSHKHGNVDSTTRSPIPLDRSSAMESSKGVDEKRENHNKSPYAQQLRQVLDVLLDEEPRKAVVIHHPEVGPGKECNCSDCQQQQTSHSIPREKHYREVDHYSKRGGSENDYCKLKHKLNGHTRDLNASPKSYYHRSAAETMHSDHHPSSYSNHCTGPCCISNDSPGGYKIIEKSPGAMHYVDKSPGAVHYVDKSPNPVHYVNVHSPGAHSEGSVKHERHQGHCGDKCSYHNSSGSGSGYVNYVPYGYHLVESPRGVHEHMEPMSPSRRKRTYVPLLPVEEPPHLKYTKVKRIDGSKLTAQKVLQDFTKRRFIAYNPRFDLDLLIVQPPVPALDLLKGIHAPQNRPEVAYNTPSPHPFNKETPHGNQDRKLMEIDSESDTSKSPMGGNADGIVTGGNSDNNNNISSSSNNNNNKIKNNHSYSQSSLFSSSIKLKTLPSIKEENAESRSKLEDHISKLRSEQTNGRPVSPYSNNNYNSDTNNNKEILKQERTMSPVSMGNRRTEQYCT